jgi:predicted DNA-binding protein
MKDKASSRKKTAAPAASTVRASISFPPEVYESLESIAREKKVSLAWAVREASEDYIAENRSLLAKVSRRKAHGFHVA